MLARQEKNWFIIEYSTARAIFEGLQAAAPSQRARNPIINKNPGHQGGIYYFQFVTKITCMLFDFWQ